jgi:hypothetical protein
MTKLIRNLLKYTIGLPILIVISFVDFLGLCFGLFVFICELLMYSLGWADDLDNTKDYFKAILYEYYNLWRPIE